MKTGTIQKTVRLITTAVVMGAAFVTGSYADIYRYVNKDGVMCFTNVPTSSKYRLYIPERHHSGYSGGTTDRYDQAIARASDAYGISFYLIKAVIKAESDFDPQAVSRSGAMGLMQIMPENCDRLNIDDPFDPYENIMAGSRFFKQLLRRYADNLPKALAAYNAGPGMVDRYQGIPPIPETQAYVNRVMKYYDIFNRREE